jgi:SpoVK/Ycf46/Vps4 family AAA+-type ATPase
MEEIPDFIISDKLMRNKGLQDYDLEILHKKFSLESLEKVLFNTLLLFKEGKNTKKINPNKALINFSLCLNILEILLELCDINANYLSDNGFNSTKNKIKTALFYCNQNMKDINTVISNGNLTNIPQNNSIINSNFVYSLVDIKYREIMDNLLIRPLIYPKLYKKRITSLLLYGYIGSGKSYIIQSAINFLKNKVDILLFDFKDIINNTIEVVKQKFINFINEIEKLFLQSSKIIIVIENIDIFFEIGIENHMIISFLQNCLKTENMYIIATSNQPYRISSEILYYFDFKKYIDLPNQHNIYNYIRNTVLDSLDIFNTHEKNILKKFNIPFLEQLNQLKKFSKVCNDRKLSYHDLKKIVKNALSINGKSSIKANSFQELNFSIDKKNITSFVSCFSIKEEYIQPDKKYILNDRQLHEIYVCENQKCKKCDNGCQSSNHYILVENTKIVYKNLDDERVKNIYINNKNTTDKYIEIISEIDINLNNDYSKFESDKNRLKISELSIRLYMQLCNLIFQNVSMLDIRDKKKIIEVKKKLPNGFNSLNDILFLDETILNNLFNIIFVPDTKKNYNTFHNKFFKVFNNLNQIIEIILPESKQEKAVISLIYNNEVINQIKLTDAINPNLVRKYLLKILDNRLIFNNITEDSRAYIKNIPCNIEIIYVKTNDGYSWYIDILPEYINISDLNVPNLNLGLFKIKMLNVEYYAYPTINVDIFYRKLNINYKITNESDVSILQEKFPEDYGDLYRDEEETWMLHPIKKTGHLNFLNSVYNDYSITFLNIYHNLLEYKKSNSGNLSMQSLIFLEKIIGDVQYKIDQLLFITVPYDENSDEITYWNASKNHRHHFDYDYDENINRSAVFYKDKYDKHYGLNLLINIFKVTGFSSIKYCFEYYKTALYCDMNNINRSIYIHSYLSMENLERYYYSEYLNDINKNNILKSRTLKESINYIKYFCERIMNKSSLYMEIFASIKHIGNLEDNKIVWYNLSITPENLRKKVLLGDFIIKNNSKEILFSLLDGVTNKQYINIISSYIITVYCYHENNNINIFSTILGVYLYTMDYITYFKNNSVKGINIVEMINNDLNNFLSIIDKRFEIFANNYVSLPVISKTQLYHYFKENKILRSIISKKKTEHSYQDSISDKILSLEYKKEEKKIYEKFGLTKKMINNNLSNMNFKMEFLIDSLKKYNNLIEIEEINKLQAFKQKYE